MPVSTATPVETLPTNESSLWMLSAFFRSNWAQDVKVLSAFETAIENALTTSEQRQGLKGKPVRTITQTYQAYSREQLRDLMSAAMRASQCGYMAPLTSDASELTQAAAATATVLHLDTRWRRIFALTRAVIFTPSLDAEVVAYDAGLPATTPQFEVVEIVGVTSNTVTLQAGLLNAYPVGSVVIPLIEARIKPKFSGAAVTDSVGTLETESVENVGKAQLPVTAALGSVPAGFDTFLTLPVLIPDADYSNTNVTWGVERLGTFAASGISAIPSMQGSRGRWNFDIPFTCLDREAAWKPITLFDSRGGRLFPFWLVSPVTEYTPVATHNTGGATDWIKFKITGTVLDWSYRPYIAIFLKSGARYYRKVNLVTRLSDGDKVEFEGGQNLPLVIAASDIALVATLHLARFVSDEMDEDWHSNTVMQSTLSAVELLDEKTITISDLEVLSSTALTQAFEPGNCSGTPFLRPNRLIYRHYSLYPDPVPWGELTGPCSAVYGGGWWQCINSKTVDGYDIPGKYVGFTGTAILEIGLSGVADPLVNTGHVVRVRLWDPFGTANTITILLKQGSTTIATIASAYDPTNVLPDTLEYTLSGAEADSITDYHGLSVLFSSVGGLTSAIVVNHFSMQVPTPP